MKEINKFKINVPELGDRPDITVVSEAISGIEDAYSGTIEMCSAVKSGSTLIISSSRKVERKSFYDGLTLQFVSNFNATIGAIENVSVDSLPAQQVVFMNDIVDGEFCLLQYRGTGFVGTVVSGKLPDDVMRTGGFDGTGQTLDDKKADRDEVYLANAPIGAIMAYASNIVPIGWLLCDGRTITREDYAELYDLIGDKLPDLRGQFVRGLDNGRGMDPNRELGSEQEDAIRNIQGTVKPTFATTGDAYIPCHEYGGALIPMFSNLSSQKITPNGTISGVSSGIKFNASLVVPTADENRPKNVALNYIIKASYLSTTVIPVTPAHELNAKIETNYNKQNEAILNNTGKSIGFNGVTYIQDDGEKVVGYLYYDKNSDGLFKCTKSGNINYNSSEYFVDYSNMSLGKAVFDESFTKIIFPVSGDATFRRVGKTVTMVVDSYQSAITDGYSLVIPDGFKPSTDTRVQLTMSSIEASQLTSLYNVSYEKATRKLTFPAVPTAHVGVATWVI